MTNFAKFTVSSLRGVLTRAINVLNGQKKVYSLGHEKHRFLEYRALVVAVTACYVECQSGYSERGTAIFQALLEANLKCPAELQLGAPRETFLDVLQVRMFHIFLLTLNRLTGKRKSLVLGKRVQLVGHLGTNRYTILLFLFPPVFDPR